MSDVVFARNCCIARSRMLPEKPSWCRNEQVCQGGGGKSVKCVGRFNGLVTADR